MACLIIDSRLRLESRFVRVSFSHYDLLVYVLPDTIQKCCYKLGTCPYKLWTKRTKPNGQVTSRSINSDDVAGRKRVVIL